MDRAMVEVIHFCAHLSSSLIFERKRLIFAGLASS